MRRASIAWGVTFIVAGSVGCSSADPEKPSTPAGQVADALSFELVGDGPERDPGERSLRLVHAGRTEYAATYPNPSRFKRMFVRIKPWGAVVSSCETETGTTVRCGDTPFFTRLAHAANGGTIVRVTDLYGEEVGRQQFAPLADTPVAVNPTVKTYGVPGSDDNGGRNAGGSTGNDDDGDSSNKDDSTAPSGDESGGDSNPKEPDDDQADCKCSGGDKPPPPAASGGGVCDEASIIKERDAFCAAVNDTIEKKGFKAIDCARLDDKDVFDNLPKPPPGATGRCMDIWQPAYRPVTEWLTSCPRVRWRATNWHEVARWHLLQMGACRSSPIVLDLDGDGIHLSSLEKGVKFDLLGTGPVNCAWVDGVDALLALDRNGNGSIDGAQELFGNVTAGRQFEDGFAALAEVDVNGDGRIDARDPAYAELVLWRDRNRDGRSAPSELTYLPAAGIRALYLGAARISEPLSLDRHGNSVPLVAGFERTDGTKGMMADVFLRFRP